MKYAAALTLVVAALCFAVAGAASASSGAARSHAQGMASVAIHPWRLGPNSPPLPFWPVRDPADRERVFTTIQSMGIHRARIDLRWNQVEPRIKGLRDWGEFDSMHSSAVAHGITLLPVVVMTPDWANGGRGVWAYPDNPQDFEDFLAAAMQRYPDIPAWEIWNEPNLPAFSQPNVDVGKYVQLLAAAHRAKLETGSSAAIVSGGLTSRGVDPRSFFEDMIRLHAFDYADGFAIHPYGNKPPEQEGSFFLTLPRYHQRLVQIGKPDVGIWLTEYGAPTTATASWFGPAIDDAAQAARLRSAFAIASRWPWVQNLTWYEFQDDCSDHQDFQCNFGLLHQDASPKPAFASLQSIVAGNLSRIASSVTLTRARSGLRGTVFTPGSVSRAAKDVTITLTAGPRTRVMRVSAPGGKFAVRRVPAGRWRAVARYAGSASYLPSASAPVVSSGRS